MYLLVSIKFVILISTRNEEYESSRHKFYCKNKNLIENFGAVSGTRLADGPTDLPIKHLFFVHCAIKTNNLTSV